jgi:transcriptional regulator with XRE-family HTH domain
MLPFCERTVSVERKDISPVWTRSFPVSKHPQTIGEHLRKKRYNSGIRQSEAAKRLGISKRTLSLWETDKVYPSWPQQSAVTAYLGYDPFINPALGSPGGNEPSSVAILSSDAPLSIGQQIRKWRVDIRKTRRVCAKELGISVKTLWGWETGRRQPSALLRKRITALQEQHAIRKPVTNHPS